MSRFDPDAFNELAVASGVAGFKPKGITLKSGRTSHWYVNWRTASGDVYAANAIAGHIVDYVHDMGLDPDILIGVPEGASPLAILAQSAWARQSGSYGPGSHRLVLGRAVPKGHGALSDRYSIGNPQGRVVVLEDVTTTGDSAIRFVERLREVDGCEPVAVVGLTNRLEARQDGRSVHAAIQEMGLTYAALSSGPELLKYVHGLTPGSSEVVERVNAEWSEHGLHGMRLE